MYNKACFAFLLLFVIDSYFLVSAGYKVPDLRFAVESEGNDDESKINETHFLQQSAENYSNSVAEEGNLFWMIPPKVAEEEIRLENQTNPEIASEEQEPPEGTTKEAMNDVPITTAKPTESLYVEETAEENKESDALPSPTPVDAVDTMNEKITLQRNNCHLEITVHETHDIKIQIAFGKLENNTSGKCCITLNGEKNVILGVLISNLHLYQNGSQGEVLKVITANYGSDFILKEYHPWSKYQPLILTETHRVYIVLYYMVAYVPLNEQDTHFNLEVFSYHKYENYIPQGSSYSHSYYPFNNNQEYFFK